MGIRVRRLLLELSSLLLVIVVACVLVRTAALRFYRAAYPVQYREIVVVESARNGLPEALVFAVIRTESGFNPAAQSSVEARGLMQITKDTFEWAQFRVREEELLNVHDLFDSELNIRYGAAILRLLLEEFGSERNALCAYHAGWGNAKAWLADPACSPDGKTIVNIPFGDTGRYVEKVMETKKTYETLYDFS